MLSGFAGGQHPNHAIPTRREGSEVGEEHLMVAQAVGGHQAVGQAPARVGDALDPIEDLGIAGQLAELSGVQAIAPGAVGPIGGKLDLLGAGQGRQGRAALLAAAAGQGIALEHRL